MLKFGFLIFVAEHLFLGLKSLLHIVFMKGMLLAQ